MKMKKTIAMLTAAILLFLIPGNAVMAATGAGEDPEPILMSEDEAGRILEELACSDGIMPLSLTSAIMRLTKNNGGLCVAWTVNSTCVADEIGIKSLKLQMYSNGVWKTIKEGSYMARNKMVYTSGYSYAGAKSGAKYRATGTAYTIVGGVKKTNPIKTDAFTY